MLPVVLSLLPARTRAVQKRPQSCQFQFIDAHEVAVSETRFHLTSAFAKLQLPSSNDSDAARRRDKSARQADAVRRQFRPLTIARQIVGTLYTLSSKLKA